MYLFPESAVCVTNRSLSPRPLAEQLERVADVGIKKVILREKDLSEDEYMHLAKEILKICEIKHMHCILHSFPKTALQLRWKSIHIPLHMFSQDIAENFLEVGVSVHSKEEAVLAQNLGASYITAGHIFETDCKKGLPGRGLKFLKEICNAVSIPVYAIGGINLNNYKTALNAGASGFCMMSLPMRI